MRLRVLFLSLLLLVPGAFAADRPTVVFLGDSLTAGFGLSQEEAYPALVAQALEKRGLPIRAVNAGVSGDTSSAGLQRLNWLLRQKPDLLVIALGGNDMLRGIPPEETRRNLEQIIVEARKQGARPVLLGIRAFSNLGIPYRKKFDSLFADLARKDQVALLPFFIRDTAMDPALNQADALHPNAKGQQKIARRVTDFLEPLIRKTSRR